MTNIIFDEISIPSKLVFFYLEDTSTFQKKMLADLAGLGFKGTITISASLKEAYEILPNKFPDFILSDWNLPDGTGLDFLKTIRANDQFNDIPFLIVTTVDDIENILEAVNIGADGYIVKPWSERELIEKIAFAFEKRVLKN